MKRILLLFYSQSGEADRVAVIFSAALESGGHAVTLSAIRPLIDYPYPWRSVRRFFDVMPETQLGEPPPVKPPHCDPSAGYDLVVLVFPVWFLSPALPIQGFFHTPQAAVLKRAPVMTISVSRAMWQQGSETMKRLLRAAGATHIDNIVVTHQGSPIATLVSTPRALLSGKREQLMGMFPKAGISQEDMMRVQHLGEVAARRLDAPGTLQGPLLAGEPAVAVKRWLIGPELLGWYCFHGWARVIKALGRLGDRPRALGVWGFALFLVCLILVGLPLTLIGTPIVYLVARGWLERAAARLAAPTGEASASSRRG